MLCLDMLHQSVVARTVLHIYHSCSETGHSVKCRFTKAALSSGIAEFHRIHNIGVNFSLSHYLYV